MFHWVYQKLPVMEKSPWCPPSRFPGRPIHFSTPRESIMKKSHEMAPKNLHEIPGNPPWIICKSSIFMCGFNGILCVNRPFDVWIIHFSQADDAFSLSTLRGGADALPADTSPAGAPFAVGGQLGKSSTRSAWRRNVDWCELMWMTSLWHRCLVVYKKNQWVLIPKGLAARLIYDGLSIKWMGIYILPKAGINLGFSHRSKLNWCFLFIITTDHNPIYLIKSTRKPPSSLLGILKEYWI